MTNVPQAAGSDDLTDSPSDRRFVMKASLATFAAIGAGSFGSLAAAQSADAPALNDVNILNFALNLEYLEAEYYLRATTGVGLNANETNGNRGQQGTVTGGSLVPFENDAVRQYAEEIAADERAHVNFLRAALGDKKVAEPQIDFVQSFNTLAQAAGLGDTFNPFASEDNFLIGAFVFEDVGVTAYKGAARFINNPDTLESAAGILAVEAYHAGIIRTVMYQRGLQSAANKISKLRDQLDGNPANQDMGIVIGGKANLVPADKNGLAASRTPAEVLGIVYAGGASGNFGFFPSKVNGAIR